MHPSCGRARRRVYNRRVDPAIGIVGGYPLYAFAVAVDAGAAAGLVVVLWLARRHSLPADRVLDTAIVTLLAALVGARAAYVAMHAPEYVANPTTALYVWEGGLSVIGAITLGALAAALWLEHGGLPVGRALDAAAPAVAIGQGIGTLGCLVSGCAAGIVPPEGSRLPVLALPNAGGLVAQRFPSQLVEAGGCLLLGLALLALLRAHLPAGTTAALYLVGYGLLRLAAEPLREDSLWLGPLPVASWWAAGAVAVGVALAWRAIRGRPAQPVPGPRRA